MKKNYKEFYSLLCLCFYAVGLFFFTGCSSGKKIDKDFLYFQQSMDSIQTVDIQETIIKSNDVLSVQVFSKSLNQDQTSVFNAAAAGGADRGYVVGTDGKIDLPLVGRTPAAGFTKATLEEKLKAILSSYVKDPTVLVRFLQFKVNVLGEVRSPGSINFDKERVTIIDAIASAGDLTDNGKRKNITVIREENSTRKAYQVDLQSGTLFQSPVYLLQPNDIVYVSANDRKLKSLNINPEKGKNFQIGSTIVAIALNIAFFIITVSRNN